jgi:hypothetical protein
VGGQHHAPAALPPGKTRYPVSRRLGGPQGRSERVGNLDSTGIRSPDRPARSQSLYRLSYPAHSFKCMSPNLKGMYKCNTFGKRIMRIMHISRGTGSKENVGKKLRNEELYNLYPSPDTQSP